jgi:hypothetical protein
VRGVGELGAITQQESIVAGQAHREDQMLDVVVGDRSWLERSAARANSLVCLGLEMHDEVAFRREVVGQVALGNAHRRRDIRLCGRGVAPIVEELPAGVEDALASRHPH